MKVNSGKLATELLVVLNAVDEAYSDVMAVSHEAGLAAKVARAYYAQALNIAHKHGFPTVDAALRHLERATSWKWVYESGLNALVIN